MSDRMSSKLDRVIVVFLGNLPTGDCDLWAVASPHLKRQSDVLRLPNDTRKVGIARGCSLA
jgi:hypothetical protein